MKFFYGVILLLAIFCGWLYQDNQEKLEEYTGKINEKKIPKVDIPKKELAKQNTFDKSTIPVEPNPSLSNEQDNSNSTNFNEDQDYSDSSSMNDNYYSTPFTTQNSSPHAHFRNAKYYSQRRALNRQNYDADLAAMDVGPADVYTPDEVGVADPDVSRTPAEE